MIWSKVGRNISLMRKDKLLYFMAIPGILYFIVFDYIPMYGILISFKDYSIYNGFMESDWVGLDNFKQLFNTYGFTRALRNTIVISFYQLIFAFPVPIILAVLLNEIRKVAFQRFVQTAIYLPHFVSWIIIGGILFAILSPSTGIIREIASFFGYEGTIPNLLNNKHYFRGVLVVSNVWKEAGFGTVLYMATITTINPQLYEAAKVDGAEKMRQIWHITLPGLRTTIVILFIFRVGQILNAGLEQVFALYSPLVYEVSEILDTYVYKLAFNEAKFALATATGVFKGLVGLTLVLIANYIAKKIDSESGLF